MIKTTAALVFLLSAMPLLASHNYQTVWDAENSVLTIRDNFGTPLGEEIRRSLQRKKGYNVYNLLRKDAPRASVSIDLQMEGMKALSPEYLYEAEGIVVEGAERFKPVISTDGRLFYLFWNEGALEIRTDDLTVYRFEEPLRFLGKRADNILISRYGRLEWLDEMDWLPVPSLLGYSVSYVRWLNDENILVAAERDSDGSRTLAISSVRRPSALFLPPVQGEFIEASAAADRSRVYSLYYAAGRYVLYRYSFRDDEWVEVKSFIQRVRLLDLEGKEVTWYNPLDNKIETPTRDIELAGYEEKHLYPYGRFLYGEEGAELYEVSPLVQRIIYYSSSDKEALEGLGLTLPSVHGENSEIWILDEKYRGTLERLRNKDIGHLWLSTEDMKIYYDLKVRGLREIDSMRIRPHRPGRIILAILSLLLLILLTSELLRSRRKR